MKIYVEHMTPIKYQQYSEQNERLPVVVYLKIMLINCSMQGINRVQMKRVQ